MKRIAKERIAVCPKTSLWRLLQHQRVLTSAALIDEETQVGRDSQSKIESDQRQMETWRKLFGPDGIFPREQVYFRENITPDEMARWDAILVAGGDNHLQFVAQFVPPHIPLIGVNSDPRPQGSHGGLCAFTADEVEELVQRLDTGRYELVHWPRLEVQIGEGRKWFATSQVRFIAKDSDRTCRVRFGVYQEGDLDPVRETQRAIPATGLIVAAPGGKTGHLSSAARFIPRVLRVEAARRWGRTTPIAYYVNQEPFFGGKPLEEDITPEEVKQEMLFGSLEVGEVMVVRSGTFDGEISIDTEWRETFTTDMIARLRIGSEHALKMISSPSLTLE